MFGDCSMEFQAFLRYSLFCVLFFVGLGGPGGGLGAPGDGF